MIDRRPQAAGDPPLGSRWEDGTGNLPCLQWRQKPGQIRRKYIYRTRKDPGRVAGTPTNALTRKIYDLASFSRPSEKKSGPVCSPIRPAVIFGGR
jgi:hypothetical protein